ncbi:MAG TPA: Ig-like domain-containing protein [Gemmatimonadales bacterium]|nr:Ig-like domain-containing protein [Gemmatimonadales bacterium]
MILAAVLALLQQPSAPAAASPIAAVEVTPATAEIGIGGTVRLRARALDAAGRELPNAEIQWFSGGGEGDVDSTGLVRGGYAGYVRVTAVAAVPGAQRPAFGQAVIRVLPAPPARVEITPAPERVLVGTRLTLVGTPLSRHGDRPAVPVTFASSNPRVASVTPDGRLTAHAPGRAVITARAGPATSTLELRVVGTAIARLDLEPGSRRARTGDVIRFRATARDAAGKPLQGFPVRWAVSGGGAAQIDDEGAFVAELPGTYTVTATLGSRSADAVVQVEARRVGRGMEVVGRVPIGFRSAEVWVHPTGTCAYLSTIADRVYAIDVSDPSRPSIVDSMVVDAQIVNDVMTTEDGAYGVFSREGASTRRNGIVVFDARDPCHPKPIAEYTETVSGGVHSSFVYRGHAYITDDATGSLRIIDIRDPYRPREVARWQTEQTEAGRYLHDVQVVDGLAYLSYWNDGLVILDVGNGIKGGSPETPRFVSQYKYDLNALYARVDQLWGLGARGTHTAWRHRNYVFVGDEVYAASQTKGLQGGNGLTFGRLHVIDVSDIERPREVAWYEPTDGGVHNVWVAGDTLYLGNYQGGARVLDISGELKGDLLRQGREISWQQTADSSGAVPRVPYAWGAVVKDGKIFVPDINTGLWILRLTPRKDTPTP